MLNRDGMEEYVVMKSGGTSGGVDVYILQKLNPKKDVGVRVVGKFPKLYPGMIVSAKIVKRSLQQISWSVEGRNQMLLLSNKVDMDAYRIQKRRYEVLYPLGFGWEESALSPEELYEALPFAKADIIHKATVDRADDPNRLKALAKSLTSFGRLQKIKDYEEKEFLDCAKKAQNEGAYDKLSDAVLWSLRQLPVFEALADGRYRDVELHQMEEYVASNIKLRNGNRFPLISDAVINAYLGKNPLGLDADQKNSLQLLTDSAPCIITGGAGVGKTTVVRALMDCYVSSGNQGEDILLAAPTGRAARRLEEKTGYEAHTIHNVLNLLPDGVVADPHLKHYNENKPLPNSLVVVDEASMIGTELMYHLLRAIRADAKVVFVGDANQLPPVDYGQPFFDFGAILKTKRLTINHRASEETDLVEAGRAILDQKPIHNGRGVTADLIREEDILGFIHPEQTGTVQYISQFNAVNAEINRACCKQPGRAFSRDDKVMFLKNRKEYSNGDFGTVIGVFDDELVIELAGGGDAITLPKTRLDELSLAYSVTVHKMQGSEADEIVAFLPVRSLKNEEYRRLLYTAITRAKKRLTIHFYKAF